jgi:DNA transposition AAA+ family ATPase
VTTTSGTSRRTRETGSFIATKEHRRFVEFADAVRREGYIGLCFGPTGVGKTLSARRYAHWDAAESLVEDWGPRQNTDAGVYAALFRSRTVFYTPTVTAAPRQSDADLKQLTSRVDICIDQHVRPTSPQVGVPNYVEMLVIDEADRLSPLALEHLHDRYDRRHLGLLLIGMPGIDKRLARYPQLYSRIGFAHHYRALDDEELTFVLTRHWKRRGLSLDLTDFTDAQAVAAAGRITRRNFRLIHRLFAQIERVMRINDLTVITNDVIETARSTLVIGDT